MLGNLILVAWYLAGLYGCWKVHEHDEVDITIGSLVLSLFAGLFGLIILFGVFILHHGGTTLRKHRKKDNTADWGKEKNV